jgi:hypothetical protein
VLLGALALMLGACGKNDNGVAAGAPAPAQGGPTATNAGSDTGGGDAGFTKDCPTGATVGGKLGMTFPGDPQVNKGPEAIVCSYTGTSNADHGPEFVLVTKRIGTTADMVRTRQQEVDGGNTPVTRAGIGDEAYSFDNPSFGKTLINLVVRKGNHVVQIGGAATLDQLASLANLLLAA